jgi:hypothetical protein
MRGPYPPVVVTWERVVELACELPEVEVGPSWGRPALKVRGKTFAGTSRHEGAIWIRCDRDERPRRRKSGLLRRP